MRKVLHKVGLRVMMIYKLEFESADSGETRVVARHQTQAIVAVPKKYSCLTTLMKRRR
jgi:hypothetical protein